MHILFHLGAHCTDDGLLIRSILRNRARLAEEGIVVPGPGRYRELLSELSTTLRGDAADAETEAMIIEAICDDDTAERVILSNDSFLCSHKVVVAADGLYPKASKSAWLRKCVPSHTVEFAIAIRNPASFLPEVLARSGEDAALPEDLLLSDLLWSEVIADISVANPGARIVVWCHEDTPFIWSEIVSELAGHDPYTQLDGEFDMLETIMTDDGMTRLRDFLDARQVTSQRKRRKAAAAFLEAHARPEAMEADVDIPGWTEETVSALTQLYEDDLARIARMPGVTFISP